MIMMMVMMAERQTLAESFVLHCSFDRGPLNEGFVRFLKQCSLSLKLSISVVQLRWHRFIISAIDSLNRNSPTGSPLTGHCVRCAGFDGIVRTVVCGAFGSHTAIRTFSLLGWSVDLNGVFRPMKSVERIPQDILFRVMVISRITEHLDIFPKVDGSSVMLESILDQF